MIERVIKFYVNVLTFAICVIAPLVGLYYLGMTVIHIMTGA